MFKENQDTFKDFSWWQQDGELLRLMNPYRLTFLQEHCDLLDKKVLDFGCGGGIFSQALTLAGAKVDGIDLSETAIEVATEKAKTNRLEIKYKQTSLQEHLDFCSQNKIKYDLIVASEIFEHLEDTRSAFKQINELLKPQGLLFISTINRNFKSYLSAKLAAEYLLRIVPKGTHDFKKFIKPSELVSMSKDSGFEVVSFTGLRYNPFFKNFSFNKSDLDINYFFIFQKVCN